MDIPKYKNWFIECAQSGEASFYFCGANVNGLFHWDMKKNETEYLGKIPMERCKGELYSAGVVANNQVVFPPRQARELLVYDITKRILLKYPIYPQNPYEKIDFYNSYGGYLAIPFEKFIFFIFRESPICVKWDMENSTAVFIKCPQTGETLYLGRDYALVGNKCYASSVNRNILLELDMQTDSIYLHKIEEASRGFQSIVSHEGNIYLLPAYSNTLLKWDAYLKRTECVKMIRELTCEGGSDGYKLISHRERLWMIPYVTYQARENDVISLDTHTGQILQYAIFDRYNGMSKWPICDLDNRCIYAMFASDSYHAEDMDSRMAVENLVIAMLDLDCLKLEEIDIPLPADWTEHTITDMVEQNRKISFLQKAFRANNLQYENEVNGLCEFLEMIKQ